MGSIATDKGIAKVGGPGDFYRQLDPERITEHILATARGDIRDVVERIMEREHPQLWRDVPPRIREAVHARVQQQLPDIVREVTDEIGANIDQLLDVKLMVIRRMEEHPELANRVFQDVGQRELRLVVDFGLVFGFLLGIPVAFAIQAYPRWWVLPVCGVAVGWITNLWAMRMIFEPVEPRRLGPLTLHGLFLRRQSEVSEVYSKIIAEDIVTIAGLGDQLLHGPRSDRTRQLLEGADRGAHAGAALPGLRRDAALGDQAGRVAALRARRRARLRGRRRAPGDLRRLSRWTLHGKRIEALAPGEARILRLLATRGPQPAVDVRTGIPHVRIASALVAPGLSMIAAETGCRYPERIKPYLNNLYRLGLIWFSREPLRESLPYQVVEAQPEVMGAMRRAGRLGHTSAAASC
jgi:Abortive infection alpha